MRPRKITPEFLERVNILKEQGLTRRQIAENLNVSYTTIQKVIGGERLGIDRSNKVPWTIENLIKLKDNYKVLPPREVCLMFNRDRSELKRLISYLGWELPESWFKKDREKLIEDIKRLAPNNNQRAIACALQCSQSLVQMVCSQQNIQCSTKRRFGSNPEELMREAYRDSADQIRVKLRGRYVKKEQ